MKDKRLVTLWSANSIDPTELVRLARLDELELFAARFTDDSAAATAILERVDELGGEDG